MVVRSVDRSPFWIKVENSWVYIDEKLIEMHPGGSAITTYRNKDATTVFHSFHTGSTIAYKLLAKLREESKGKQPEFSKNPVHVEDKEDNDANIGHFDISEEKAAEIAKDFERLRVKVRQDGLLDSSKLFYARKLIEAMGMLALSWYLVLYTNYYITAALIQGLAWQQLGWYLHECAHHQVFKNHFHNDLLGYFSGPFLQGFSSAAWKEQHNIHHAATNVVGRDGDLDLLPFFSTVVSDLKLIDNWVLKMVPYQHIYWTLVLPLLRLSWLNNSAAFIISMPANFYRYHRERAVYEQTALTLHWSWVILQLYFLPDFTTALKFFLISQLFSGWLTAHVVTYNHYSVEKFTYDSRILENYPCLQVYTTRNMNPGRFIDWLWGGLNYQIEHHLFPTMPRHNLSTVMPLVKAFCKKHDIPYMVDGYFTGWWEGVQQFKNVALVAARERGASLF